MLYYPRQFLSRRGRDMGIFAFKKPVAVLLGLFAMTSQLWAEKTFAIIDKDEDLARIMDNWRLPQILFSKSTSPIEGFYPHSTTPNISRYLIDSKSISPTNIFVREDLTEKDTQSILDKKTILATDLDKSYMSQKKMFGYE